jgi:large subunit ribosomal protein L15
MKLNQIAGRPGARSFGKRIGRGIGSGKGKTGGRGVKGQKSRTGVRIKGFEGGQMPTHRRLPKRGFANIFALHLNEVNLGRVQTAIDKGKLDAGKPVTAEALVAAGVLNRALDGVRILGGGELKAKVAFEVHGVSKSAAAAVEKLGGSVKRLAPPKPDRAPKEAKEAKKEPKKESKPKEAKEAAAVKPAGGEAQN